jgi:hypothetical protein
MSGSYIRSKPSFEGAARGDVREQLLTYQYFHDRITDLDV